MSYRADKQTDKQIKNSDTHKHTNSITTFVILSMRGWHY